MGMEGLFIKVSLQTIFKQDARNYFEWATILKKKNLREDTLQLYQFIKCKELFFSKHLGISYRNKKLIWIAISASILKRQNYNKDVILIHWPIQQCPYTFFTLDRIFQHTWWVLEISSLISGYFNSVTPINKIPIP
jgi:hypothetical protein